MSAEEDSFIREDGCEIHKEVVWDFRFPQSSARSPAFAYRNQQYQLSMSMRYVGIKMYVDVCLNRKGPACRFPDRAVRWWAGLKRPDGTYYHSNENGTLDLGYENKYLNLETDLKLFRQSDVEKQRLASNGRLVFFLRLYAKQALPAAVACVHGECNE